MEISSIVEFFGLAIIIIAALLFVILFVKSLRVLERTLPRVKSSRIGQAISQRRKNERSRWKRILFISYIGLYALSYPIVSLAQSYDWVSVIVWLMLFMTIILGVVWLIW